jgi:hypothetical protein
MPSNKSKQLLVEGIDDLLVVVGLMEHHVVQWEREKEAVIMAVLANPYQALKRSNAFAYGEAATANEPVPAAAPSTMAEN